MEKLSKEEFEILDGKGIKIGIVDSGYVTGIRNVDIGQGINFANDKPNEDYTDQIGHGTACAGIIYKKAPAAKIYPVKIFGTELVSDMEKLSNTIKWCIKQKLNIINISLGTTESKNKKQLQEICNSAISENIFIVAAVSNDGNESYPALLDNVFGVSGGKIRGKYEYFIDRNSDIQFIARGDRQRLDWLDKPIFIGGTSFAAPHISAIIALLLQKYSGINFNELIDILEKNSLPEKPQLVDGREFYSIPASHNILRKPTIKLSEIQRQNNISWIKNAVVFPYNKEMHALIRYKDLLSFQISGVADIVGKNTIGKDSGEIIGTEKSGVLIDKSVENCLDNTDTIILGYLDEISRIKRRDILKEMFELALKYKKHIYSLTPINRDKYPEIYAEFQKKHLHIASPVITIEDYKNLSTAFDWRIESETPIVGIFGTSPQQGKFTTQLALRQELLKEGYKVGQLGTEHQSALFGFDYTFPNGYDGHQNINIPMDLHIPLLQSAMVGIEHNNPNIIIVGGQSGLIPYSYAEKSQVYTLSSILLLMGTVPDAYILVVNSIDDDDFIRQNIQFLKTLGKGETILLVFSDKKKEIINTLGRSSVVYKSHTPEVIQQITERLEKTFNIPATEVISITGRKKMLKTVEDYFAEK